MGSWSIKPFGNDSALDWFAGLEETKDSCNSISETIDLILNNYDGCATKAEEATAAIAIVAAASISPIGSLNKNAKTWIAKTAFVPTSDMVNKASNALSIISTKSELFDLWEETNSFKTWLNDLKNIQNTLTQAQELPKRKPKKKVMPRLLYKQIEFYKENPDILLRDKIFDKINSIKDVNVGGNYTDHSTPLSLVVKHGLEEETKLLLTKGADPNIKTHFEPCPFVLACTNGYLVIADLLLNSGASLTYETTINLDTGVICHPDVNKANSETLNLKTYKYCIALNYVVCEGDPEAIDYLISHGANINQLDINDETLMKKARRCNNKPVIKHLKKLGLDFYKVKG